MHNLASLPHISIAGAVATATHGSGDANGNLATAVRGLELVTSAGDVVTFSRGDADFDGVVVGLGALGAVTRITLDVEPAFEVRQRVFEGLSWEALHEHFDAITASGYSVSVFTRWGENVDQVWIKSRVTDAPERSAASCSARSPRRSTATRSSAWTRSTARRSSASPARGRTACRTSAWASRRATARRSSPSTTCPAARRSRRSRPCTRSPTTLAPVLQVSEIRTVAADGLWMSPQYGQATVGLHFTWTREPEAVARVLVALEAALAPFQARPHWGKVFLAEAATLAPRYERLADFAAPRAAPGPARRLPQRLAGAARAGLRR